MAEVMAINKTQGTALTELKSPTPAAYAQQEYAA